MFREGRSVKMRSLWNRSWRLLPRENWVRLGNGRLTSPRRNRKEDSIQLKLESPMQACVVNASALNRDPVLDYDVFGDDDDAIPKIVEGVIQVLGFAAWRDYHVIADARILVDDGIFDPGILANADARFAEHLVL